MAGRVAGYSFKRSGKMLRGIKSCFQGDIRKINIPLQ